MKLKKIMAIVLCFAMVLSTMSFSVIAEDTPDDTAVATVNGVDHETFDAAYKAAETGDTIVLHETVVIDSMMKNYNSKTVTIKAEGLDTAFLVTSDAFMVTFGNMTVESDGTCITVGTDADSYNPTVDINGGTYKGGESAIFAVSGLVRINDGVFFAENSDNTIDADSKYVNINGGKFYNFNPTDFIPGNRLAQQGADGYWTVAEAAAKIGEVKYVDLISAISAAQSGETVTLLRNISLGDIETIIIPKNITIDGEGYWTINIDTVNDAWNMYNAAFAPRGPITYTVKNLTVDLENASPDMAAFSMKYGGTLENVTVKGGFEYGVHMGMATNPLTVNDCIFDDATWGVYVSAQGADISITGSKFNTDGVVYVSPYCDIEFTENIIAADSYIESYTEDIEVSKNFWNGDNTTGGAPTESQLKGDSNYICETYYASNDNGELSDLTNNGEVEAPVIRIEVGSETYEYNSGKLSFMSELLGSLEKEDAVITLLDDVSLENGIQLAAYGEFVGDEYVLDPKSVVIDLNGKTLNGFIQINGSVTATIKNGTVNNTNSSYAAIDVSGTATLEDLIVESVSKAFKVYEDAELIVKQGTYSSNPASYVADGYVSSDNGDGTFSVAVKVITGLSGTGTEDDPYLINDINELEFFRDSVNSGDTTYNAPGVWVALGADIDMADTVWTEGIGDGTNATFDGNFDGNNHIIKNFTMNPTPDADNYLCGGLFGYIYGNVQIKDLVFENVTITSDATGHNVGVLVGFANNNGGKAEITNVTVKGDIKVDTPNTYGVGAIVGYSYRDMGKIADCAVEANDGSYINGYSFVGGITGYSYSNAVISGCSVKNIDITATNYSAGGIAGIVLGGNKIIGCTVDSSVTVTGQANVGSVVGALATDVVDIEDCVAAEPMVGGNYSDNKDVKASIGNKYFTSFAEALDAAQNGDTVTLHADVKLTGKLTLTKAITIDGNGYSIIADETAQWYTVSGKLNTKTYNIHLIGVNSDNVTLKNIVLDNNNNAAGINIYCAQNVVFDNVSIINATKGYAALTVNGSTLTVKTNLTALGNAVAIDISNGSGVTSALGVTVEDGTVFNLGDKTVKFASVAVNDMTGAKKADGTPYFAAMDVAYYYTEAQIENRTTAFSNGLTLLTDIELSKDIIVKGTIDLNGNTMAITDGKVLKIEGNLTIAGDGIIDSEIKLTETTATISGPEGLNITTDLEGYVVKYENGTYSLKQIVAQIGDTKYASLKDAFEAAQDGDTVKLIEDISLDEIISNTKKITLDLGGKTITGTDNTEKNFSLIDNRGELTITGNGKMTLTASINSGWNRYSAVLANNPGGKLTIENGTIEHLGGTDMAYGIDNLTNGKGTYAETIINGGTIKSTYRGIRQFLNGVEAQNILTVNGGTIEGANKSIWMQDPSTKANTGTLTVNDGATLNGDVYLFVTAGSTEWPVEVKIAASAVNGEVLSGNVPFGYEVLNENGYYGVKNSTSSGYTITAVADKTEVRYNNNNTADSFTVKYIATGGDVIGAMAQFDYDTTLFTCDEDPNETGKIRMNSMTLTTDANGETLLKELHFKVKKNVEVDTTYEFIAKYVQVVSDYDAAGSGTQDGFVENLIGVDVTIIAQYDVTLPADGSLEGNTYVDQNADYSAVIKDFDENKIYTITYEMGGTEYIIEVDKDTIVNGGFVIEDVAGDLVFTEVTSQLNFELILLPEAVTGYTLVLVKDGVSAGYTYDGVEMYAIDRYVGLTEIADNDDREAFVGGDILGAASVRAMLVKGGVTLDEARAAIAVSANASDTLNISYDVNRNGAFWFNDAATAHGCYKDQYTLKENMTKLNWYLSADVNTDFVVDTDDYDDTVAAFWATVEP